MKRLIRLVMVAALSIGWQLGAVPAAHANEENARDPAASGCHLGNDVKHVVNLVFDNVHFTRDNPNVPSDLEQMPALLNFLKGQGTLLTNEHTPLIAHTATDILTSLTGVYGDRMGVPVSNNYIWYNSQSQTRLGFSFAYWTDKVGDGTYNMLAANGMNAPAPWVPFTRAGCNVGGVSTANIELESNFNIPTVFGVGSPEAIEAQKSDPHTGQPATGDFVGIAIHCAKGNAVCASSAHARPDVLPQEPRGYAGFQGLFGHKYVAPAINHGLSTVNATDGTALGGFPGFDQMPAANTLGYVAQMLENNVPVVYGYISDAHAGHTHFADRPFGPGEADYVAQLKEYNDAFTKFFGRLAKDGINRSNTVFIVTADEGDHLIAGPPSPAKCDGVKVPCTYAKIGEVSANLAELVGNQSNATTSFDYHFDSAPTVSIEGNPPQTAGVTRDLERAVGNLTAVNPYTNVSEKLTNFLADRAQMRLLHMLTADPNRDPTFTMFAKPDYFFSASASGISINSRFNWNHGDIAPEINTTWLGIVGPDVRHLGKTGRFWTDHSDIRPTLLALTGLKDDYAHQGRPITEIMEDSEGLNQLAAVYKQINAPVGQLSLDSIRFATNAINSTSAGDQTYIHADATISSWTAERNALAGQMIVLLDTTAPASGEHDDEDVGTLIKRGRALLAEVHQAAA
jgi:hypothetical protein